MNNNPTILSVLALILLLGGVSNAQVVISEFMAKNTNGILDEDGDRSDWIELFNAGDSAVNLGGWHLTDDAGDLDKWSISPVALDPGQHLLIWASGKNRKDPDEELHTNFKLSAGGEYLALVKPDEVTVVAQFSPQFPPQVDDVSYGFDVEYSTNVVLTTGNVCTAFVPSDDSLGLDWTYPGFDDSTWTNGLTGIGYERSSGYEGLFNLDVESLLYNVHPTLYSRIPFVVPDGMQVDRALLRMRYDDGFRAYLNGAPIASANITGSYSWDEDAPSWVESSGYVSFPLSGGGAFQAGTNVLAIHGVNDNNTSSDFLLLPELTVYTVSLATNSARFFAVPTPGSGNVGGTDNVGPRFSNVRHLPHEPLPTEDLVVTVDVVDPEDGVDSIDMVYEIMFNGEATLPMALVTNNTYTALIPASAYEAGEMIRYRFLATDGGTNTSRWPLYHDPDNAPEFFGTMARTNVTSSMPVYHWFIEDTARMDTGNESRSSVFYNGVLYDNIMTRTRGGSTENNKVTKKSHKFDFNRGHHFEYDPDERKVEEVNLNTTLTDKTYLRRMLAWNSFRDAGAPYCNSFLVYLRRNNAFFGVQNFEEQIDDDYLVRHGFDTEGLLYKIRNCPLVGNPRSLNADQHTRKDEPHPEVIESYFDDIQGSNKVDFVYDNMNLAGVLNYMAAITLCFDGDHTKKNHFLYKDVEGTGDWDIFAWDKDLTFGKKWIGGLFQDDIRSLNSLCVGQNNVLFHVVWNDPGLKALYLRRLRSVIDRFLQPASTREAERYYETMIENLLHTHQAEFELDYFAWGNPWSYGNDLLPGEANTNYTRNIYLDDSRSWVYAQADLPTAQTGSPSIVIDHVEVTPTSGNQAEEYIRLHNPNGVAVDISGWSLSNAVRHVFAPGSVIPTNGHFYVSPDTGAFRRRATSPKAGENLFVQGTYKGMLSSRGETLSLHDATGAQKDSITWPADLSDAQRWLRITEVMYHPALPDGADFTEDRLEFVELKNTGPSPLSVSGTYFSAGLVFTNPAVTLPAGGYLVLASDPVRFADAHNTNGMTLAGPFAGYLSNGNDTIELEDHRGETIHRFTYSDDWYVNTDGNGFSLTLLDPANTNLSLWNEKAAWRASLDQGGSPGTDDTDHAPGSIVINEILAHSDTGGDWVEIKNMTEADIDLSYWFLSDDNGDPAKFPLPAATTLPSNGFVVVHESAFNSGSNAFALSELGDEVVLSRAKSDGTLQGYRTSRDFDASDKDVSLGRWIDSEGDTQFIPMAEQTPGAENGIPRTGPVIISEIMYAPAPGMAEYVELYNSSTQSVALYDPAYPTNRWSLTDAVGFVFPESTSLPSGQFLLVCATNPAAFRIQYSIPPDVDVFGPFDGALDNAGERIRLKHPGNPEPSLVPQIQLESVNYKPSVPWPLPPTNGVAIERVYPTSPANDPVSWRLGTSYGSPGMSSLGDGPINTLPEAYKLDHFGSLSIAGSGEGEDFDRDGKDNLSEFISGTTPTSGSDRAEVTISILTNGSIEVSIGTRQADPAYAFGLQRYYTLQHKTRMTDTWQDIAGASNLLGSGQTLNWEPPVSTMGLYRATIELH